MAEQKLFQNSSKNLLILKVVKRMSENSVAMQICEKNKEQGMCLYLKWMRMLESINIVQ